MSEKSNDNSFRDSISTIGEDGKRAWIFPTKPNGPLYQLRSYASYIYLALFFGLPFIEVDGHPLFLINVLERKFILFGAIFWPQDFIIFGLAMITGVIFIALFTVIYGRVFCGWACPQTIFMEMIFRRIEYWVEGDAKDQRTIENMPWNAEKIKKRGFKLVLFFIVSFIIANFFLSYFIGIKELEKIITEPISQHKGGFTGILIFTAVFFFVYTWFREQVCLVVCPYGRLQGVLLDRDSIVVAYDYKRGEPRGHLKKNETKTTGDCVDCSLCVKVCPTGIDIRNGTQLECINCTACIDACDQVMDKVGFEKGLIRYTSENSIAEGKKKLVFTTRMKAYTVVLSILMVVLFSLILTRSEVETTIMRTPGQLFQEQPNNQYSNLYSLKIANKTFSDLPIQLKLENMEGSIKLIGKDIEVKQGSTAAATFFVLFDKKLLKERKTNFKIGVYSGDKKIETVTTNFMAPIY